MDTLNLIYFSPTGTTQKIVQEIGRHVGMELGSEHNFTKLNSGFIPEISANSLTIIGVPVYGGRLPLEAAKALSKFKANQSLAAIVAVYGNRDYDDALLELNDIVTDSGFKVIAGAAFIGEHSFSSVVKPIAHGRPDENDLKKCEDFAKKITEKLNGSLSTEFFLPGNNPYKKRKPLPVSVHPETDSETCNLCGTCAEVCPTNAITIEKTATTNDELCIWCNACVKSCPSGARSFDNPTINATKERLFVNCSERKEPEYFV